MALSRSLYTSTRRTWLKRATSASTVTLGASLAIFLSGRSFHGAAFGALRPSCLSQRRSWVGYAVAGVTAAGPPGGAQRACSAASAQLASTPFREWQLVTSDGEVVNAAEAVGSNSVALYFAGSWCPMCVAFTPKLIDFMKASDRKRIIVVSSDFTPEEFTRHRATLPKDWLAVPYGSPLQDSLKKTFRIWGGRERPQFGDGRRGGIPALVVLDPGSGEEVKYLDTESKDTAALREWPA
eukprot:TRINITY_DN54907_c0_g1_i1.p1 TRINITY_DN54907_c0_g1~~TRINITY_DN54907_c0_g1_i1.p1  ORF type:complete len:239 (+),score=39.93 TRINITY_DN54907_c0_g1_i1:50-766(+)